MPKKILITGASGFIGGFIVGKAIESGYEVWAGVRASSSKAYLQDERIHFIELNLQDKPVLKSQLNKHIQENSHKWDFVIHAAGATKGKNEESFFHTNYEGTRILVESLSECNLLPERFVFLSSLSVFGAIRQHPDTAYKDEIYAPILESDTACPNTAYARSKKAAEDYLKSRKDIDYVIVQPTGVYGPKEKDYFMLVKSIKNHTDFSVGFKPQRITFVYVKDLVEAIFLAMLKGEKGRNYLVSDGKSYNSTEFSILVQQELGIKRVVRIKAPLWLLKAICRLGSLASLITGKATALNNDKYNILKQRNWRCDISSMEALGYKPQYDLRKGVKETIKWYKGNNWI